MGKPHLHALDSKGKSFHIQYQLSEKSPSDEIKIVTNESSLNSVYFVDKIILIKNPQLLFRWIANKLSQPLAHSLFWLNLIYMVPFVDLLLFYQKNRNLK